MSFKIFAKVLTNRLIVVADEIIGPTKSAFLRGRLIMDGVVVLHEIIHELHRGKMDVIFFKINFEKAYDKVSWHFLQQTLGIKGFSSQWCGWISKLVQGGSVSIK